MVRVCVVGSLNMDLVVKAPRLPRVGETVSGGTFATFPGGKGANQAVAAARLGARVAMVGRVGGDPFGRQLVDGLKRDGIDVAHVGVDPGAATGVAQIGVDGEGRNMIMVASGANMRVAPAAVDEARDVIAGAHVLLLQLEIPIEAVVHAATVARAAGAVVCLDPAPAAPLPVARYACVDVINPSEVEAEILTGVAIHSIADAERAAAALRERGPRVAVVKMGDRGAFFLSPDEGGHVPAVAVKAVDTTAAGDAFAAALGVALGEGGRVADAVTFATHAAGIKVTRMGAQAGMPTRVEVEEAMRR
ncbi:MAG: ribokinase [Bacillati bacterium ANGP1]|uniref:Ribokinase n=1 Tax=Candidatus Segetimicrobium genomatis TaxID=2569760 RepID=A0A537M4S4_9BACT|nr:MAG: ribokinase [Terrabacteria group bacterium ANGP1]